MRRTSTLLTRGFALFCASLFASTPTRTVRALGTPQIGTGAQQPGGDPEAAQLQNPVPATPESIAVGQKHYQRSCQFCHGPKGLGDGPAAPPGVQVGNLADGKWAYGSSDGEIFAVIKNGVGPKFDMPGVKGRLQDTDIWHLVNYVRTLEPKATL